MDRAVNRRGTQDIARRHRRGRLAEAVAADYFFVRGFALVGANLRAGHLELDLVLEQDDRLIVVEVRSRGAGAFESALASVRWKKREQIKRATERLWRRWLHKRAHLQHVRFDIVTVAFAGPRVDLEHVTSAFA
jgi:putative endonuclease